MSLHHAIQLKLTGIVGKPDYVGREWVVKSASEIVRLQYFESKLLKFIMLMNWKYRKNSIPLTQTTSFLISTTQFSTSPVSFKYRPRWRETFEYVRKYVKDIWNEGIKT